MAEFLKVACKSIAGAAPSKGNAPMTKSFRPLATFLALVAVTVSMPAVAGGWKAALEMNAKIRVEAHATERKIAGAPNAEKKCEFAKQAAYKMREAREFSEIAVQAAESDPQMTRSRLNKIRAVQKRTLAEEQVSKNLVARHCSAAN